MYDAPDTRRCGGAEHDMIKGQVAHTFDWMGVDVPAAAVHRSQVKQRLGIAHGAMREGRVAKVALQ
jgi:hypothetical protein